MGDLNIAVCVKAVPGSTEVKMDPETNTIVRDGGQAVINPFDASALECALAIKDELAGCGKTVRVTAVSMGIPATEALLRDCIARGADDALLLTDRAFAGADTLATTYALSRGIDWLEAHAGRFDLVICGKMAVDGDTAQIGPELAGIMGAPCVADVQEVVEVTADHVTCRRGTDDGTSVVEAPLPCVLAVDKTVADLRMPSISGVLAAQDAEVEVLGAADAGADPARCGLSGSPTQVVRSFVPERGGDAVAVGGGAAEQAAALIDVFEEVAR